MSKYRVYELAKEFTTTSKLILDILARNNMPAKNHMASIEEEAYQVLVRTFAPKPDTAEEIRERQRKKAAAAMPVPKVEPPKAPPAPPPPCLTRWLGSLSAPPWRGQAQRPQTPRACDNTQGLAALREPSGNHEFDQRCRELGIEHRLTKPRTPITNGMVERFNGHLADVLKSHRFNSNENIEQSLLRYVALYNHQLPQSALKSRPLRKP